MNLPILMNLSASEVVDNSGEVIDKVSENMSQYGIAVAIIAVFFVIFLLLVFLILRNNAKIMNQFMARQNKTDKFEDELLKKLVDSALDARLGKPQGSIEDQIANGVERAIQPIQKGVDAINAEYEYDEKVHRDLVGNYIDINIAFKDASRQTQASLNCSRVAIYVFHNGNKSLHGLPFFKMSCIHEWTIRGANTLRGKSHVDLPLHLFSDFIENLWNKGFYKSENIAKSEEIDPSIEEFVSYSKTKAFYLVAVRDMNDSIAGFVAAEFENEDTFETDEARDKEIRAVLDKMALKVSPILSYHHISNK